MTPAVTGAPAADPQVVQAYARELVGKADGARVLALCADPRYHGPERLTVGDVDVLVRGCVSALAVREALLDMAPGGYAVLLTDRPADDLGDSLVAAFRRQRIEPLDPWATVPGLFTARRLDAGLRHDLPWLPSVLLDLLPAGAYPPSPTPVLTREHALGAVTSVVLGLPADALAPSAVVDALNDLAVRTSWAGLPADARHAVGAWVAAQAGAAAGAALTLAADEATAHLRVAGVGLLLDVLYGADTGAAPGVVEPRQGWEHGLRLPRVPAAAARLLGEAARDQVRRLGTAGTREALAELAAVWRDAEAAFALAGFPAGAARSPSLPAGYTARLSSAAAALRATLPPTGLAAGDAGPVDVDAAALAALEDAADALRAHDLAADDPDTERVAMAVRLVRWLATRPAGEAGTAAIPPRGLAGALARQVGADGWVDRAVADVWSGTTRADLADAFAGLCRVVLATRRDHDRATAQLLADATAQPILPPGVVPVERVLADVVAPLTRVGPVLLVVVDGMSAAVAAAVGDGISRLAWVEHVPAAGGPFAVAGTRAAVLAALPTMTRFSRTSLLCGELRQGTQADEKRAFATLTTGPLLHKDDLRAPAGSAVAPAVESAVAGAAPVVGVVLNTVDDTLAKHDPDGTRWSVPAIQHLEPLLDLARRHGRIVVLTADHGHVVERGGRYAPRELAETRWRPAVTGPAEPEEVLLAGPRVLAGGGSIVAPWVEDLRYGPKAAGYHGGASAAEVAIPLLVLTGRDVDLSGVGWAPTGDQAPAWWRGRLAAPEGRRPAATGQPPVAGRPGTFAQELPRPAPAGEALFEVADLPAPPRVPATSADPHAQLLDAFLASAGYARARAGAGRATPGDVAVRDVLLVLLRGGGRASSDDVARVLGVTRPRLRFALSALQSLLNVERYPVVSLDADERTVLLDEALWREQFGLGQI